MLMSIAHIAAFAAAGLTVPNGQIAKYVIAAARLFSASLKNEKFKNKKLKTLKKQKRNDLPQELRRFRLRNFRSEAK
jgi:hypothetical protein